MPSWKFFDSLTGTRPQRYATPPVSLLGGPPGATKGGVEMAPGKTFLPGEPLIFTSDGKLDKTAAQTDKPLFVCNAKSVSSAGGGEHADVVPAGVGEFIWKVKFTPRLLNKVGLAGGSTTSIKLESDAAYSNNDWVGGKVFCVETKQLLTITASDNPSGSGQTLTLTVTEPLISTSVGKTFHATPLGLDVHAGKLDATDKQVPSQAIADLTGGKLRIMGVDLENREVYFMVID